MVKDINTHDINEASYYMLFGGKMVSVSIHKLSTKTAGKKGYVDQWVITMKDVLPWLRESWKAGVTYGNITEFVNVRTKLKRKIKRELKIG